MSTYYTDHLSAERLRRCYELAPPRVQRYLAAEIAFVVSRMDLSDSVLELGCGYGRVLQNVLGKVSDVVGIDTSRDSLRLARKVLGEDSCRLYEMDAIDLRFDDREFDLTFCVQNGISAFGVDRRRLIREAVRVTRPRGKILFSTYSPQFWRHRLEWFQLQSRHGLIGEIDLNETGDGVIVCRDGFRATTVTPDDFASSCDGLSVTLEVFEVDHSSLFFELQNRDRGAA